MVGRRRLTAGALGCLAAVLLAAAPAAGVPRATTPAASAAFAATARAVDRRGRLEVTDFQLEGEEEAVTLELTEFDVWAADAQVVLQNRPNAPGRVQAAPNTRYFRGRVAGSPDSLAFVSVREDGSLGGLASHRGGTWALGKPRGGAGGLRARRADAAAADQQPFECGNDAAGIRDRGDRGNGNGGPGRRLLGGHDHHHHHSHHHPHPHHDLEATLADARKLLQASPARSAPLRHPRMHDQRALPSQPAPPPPGPPLAVPLPATPRLSPIHQTRRLTPALPPDSLVRFPHHLPHPPTALQRSFPPRPQFVEDRELKAQIALETDAEFLAKFGGNTAAAIDYVGDLLGCEPFFLSFFNVSRFMLSAWPLLSKNTCSRGPLNPAHMLWSQAARLPMPLARRAPLLASPASITPLPCCRCRRGLLSGGQRGHADL
jgi:hypothetical protein